MKVWDPGWGWMRGGSWTKPKIQKVHLLWPKDWRLLCIREFYAVSCRLEQTATIFYDFSWMQNCSKYRAYFLLRSSVCQLLCMSLFLSPARFVLTWPVHSLSPLSSHVFSWPDMFRDMDHTGSVCSQNPWALLRSAEVLKNLAFRKDDKICLPGCVPDDWRKMDSFAGTTCDWAALGLGMSLECLADFAPLFINGKAGKVIGNQMKPDFKSLKSPNGYCSCHYTGVEKARGLAGSLCWCSTHPFEVGLVYFKVLCSLSKYIYSIYSIYL